MKFSLNRLRQLVYYVSDVPHPWLSLAWTTNNGSWVPLTQHRHYLERHHTAHPMRVLLTGHFVHYHAWPVSSNAQWSRSITLDLLTERDACAAAKVYDSGRFSASECAKPPTPPQTRARTLVAQDTPLVCPSLTYLCKADNALTIAPWVGL